jgi:hypothetical protein
MDNHSLIGNGSSKMKLIVTSFVDVKLNVIVSLFWHSTQGSQNNYNISVMALSTIDIERRKIDCLMTGTACLICFISTVNDHNKKEDYYEWR